MPNEVMKLAFDEARSALKEQDATLASIRNRATGMLGAASILTTFATGVGFIGNDPLKGSVLPVWAGWTLVAQVVVVGACVMVVLWPHGDWHFGPDPKKILDASHRPVDEVLRDVTVALIYATENNNRPLRVRMWTYRATVLMLLTQVVVVLIALVIVQG